MFRYYPLLSKNLQESFFTYHVKKDRLYFSPENPLHLPSMTKHFLAECRKGSLCIPADFVQHLEDCAHCCAGHQRTELLLPAIDESDAPIWYEMNLLKPCNETLCIGRLSNISALKAEHAALVQKAKSDGLTGLLNKTATGELCKEYLADSLKTHCALFVIDVDNFKQVNDKYGHPYGDYILHAIGHKLRCIFTEEGVIGRFGGDEFLVFLKQYGSIAYLEQKANFLCTQIAAMSEEEECSIACSVGIAVHNRHQNFDRLFLEADGALYEAKRQGKNCFCFASDADL